MASNALFPHRRRKADNVVVASPSKAQRRQCRGGVGCMHSKVYARLVAQALRARGRRESLGLRWMCSSAWYLDLWCSSSGREAFTRAEVVLLLYDGRC
jgi:hypothetical protein